MFRSIVFLLMCSVSLPAMAQKASNDDAAQLFQGILRQMQQKEPAKPTPPEQPNAACDIIAITHSYYSVVLHCATADEWGMDTFFIPLQSATLKAGRPGDVNTQMKVDLAKTALTHLDLALNIQYRSKDVPHTTYCLQGAIEQNRCREAVFLTVSRRK